MTDSAAAGTASDGVPVFQSSMPMGEKLDRAGMPRSGKGARSIPIVDEKSAEILRFSRKRRLKAALTI